jgi:hypothetical protein
MYVEGTLAFKNILMEQELAPTPTPMHLPLV